MEEELKEISKKIQRLKETNEVEFLKINFYVEGYLAGLEESKTAKVN